ncbi:calmodulin-A-like protein [Dinothrombium tinctorium]|uniref:Calmodulin-A-like protein n=1 Tax=Dinothrombium tinctorium TaxID=1965070 RepID=A0A3S4RIK2_9ACAR|nr:calmodulin-A-like protein [Dinothrombium tinctorium]
MADLIDEKQLRSAFNDAKGSDGKVAVDEFKKLLKTHGLDPNDKLVASVLNEIGDKPMDDAALSLFFEHLESKLNESVEKDINLRKIFNIIDADKNGYLDRYEIKMAFAMLDEPFTEKDVEDLMTEADTDRDGRISYDEFRNSESSKKFAVGLA